MCKRIEELVADQFRNFTGVVVKDENQLLNLEVFRKSANRLSSCYAMCFPIAAEIILRFGYRRRFCRLCGERGRQAYGFLSERLGNCPTDDRKQCFDP